MCLHVDIFMRRKDFKSYYGLHNEQKHEKKINKIKLQMNDWMNECMNNFYRASPNYNRIDCDKNKEYSLDKQMKKQQQKQEHTHNSTRLTI